MNAYSTKENFYNPASRHLSRPSLECADVMSYSEESREAGTTCEDLLAAVGKSRDRDAFIRLFEYFAPRIKSFMMKGGMTPDAADDLAQEAMLTVWQKAAQYDPRKAAASTWIFTIARNRKVDVLRKKSRQGPYVADFPAVEDTDQRPDEYVNHKDGIRAIAHAIDSLPPEQAGLIRKAYFEEKSHSDIAAEENLPLGTVKSRIRLALEKLRRSMGEDRA